MGLPARCTLAEPRGLAAAIRGQLPEPGWQANPAFHEHHCVSASSVPLRRPAQHRLLHGAAR